MKMSKFINHKLQKRRVLALTTLTVLVITLLAVGTSAADPVQDAQLTASTPAMINYQGVIKVNDVLYNGNGYFKFAIVNSSGGNGTTNYWANDGTASSEPSMSVSLTVNNGLFSLLLGDTSLVGMSQSIGGTVFENDPTYLRIWFSQSGAPGSYEALEPNQRIASVGYALHTLQADMVDGLHASASPSANSLIALDSSAYLRVPRVLDSNNTSYYLDPAGSTNVNNMWATHYSVNTHEANTGYTVSNSLSNHINYGLRVKDPGMSGVWISGAGNDGIFMSSAAGDGMYIGATGEHGINIYGPNWSGVHVDNTDASGLYVTNAGWGVYVENSSYYGVNARGNTAGGFFRDSDSGKYAYIGYGNYGVYSNGTIRGTSFTTTTMSPTDASKVIEYSVLEGGEAGTYYRGTAQLQSGTAVVILPEHFSLMTEEEGLTVQVTPRADCNGLYVAEVTTASIVVKELGEGTSNVPFDYLINGIRVGYLDYQVPRESAELMPEEEGTHVPAKMGE
jgi:hypothetical protein